MVNIEQDAKIATSCFCEHYLAISSCEVSWQLENVLFLRAVRLKLRFQAISTIIWKCPYF